MFRETLLDDLALDRLRKGDRLRVVDASPAATIAAFAIPDDGRARTAILRARALDEARAAWNRFFKAHSFDAAGSLAGDAGTVLLPQILTHLATQSYADYAAGDGPWTARSAP